MIDAGCRARGCAAIAVLLVLGAVPALAEVERVGAGALCVTNGAVSAAPGGKLAIETPSSRAWARGSDGQSAEIRFRYLGPSSATKPLASGELRRQIGIKLHAQDSCNLLYVMWHIEPDAKIAVSIKRNPNQHTHAECHANGYTTLKPASGVALPPIAAGEAHTLRAELSGGELTVLADGRRAWVGPVGGGLAGIEGPAGFRTDNARFEFEYFAKIAATAVPSRCVQQPGD